MGYPKQVVVRKVAIGPVACYSEGKAMLGEAYWLFLGICLVGSILGGLVPVVLLGPAYCGIALCLLSRAKGEPVLFEQLFKGFDYFVPGLIATLIYVGVFVVLFIPFFIAIIAGMTMVASGEAGIVVVGGILLTLAYTSWIFVAMAGWMVYLFAVFLIADKQLEGFAAMQYALKGVLKNFWGLIGTVLVGQLMIIAGTMLCVVPGILLIPMLFAGHFMAYWKIFGIEQPEQPVMAIPVD